jgi:hypothetical protein
MRSSRFTTLELAQTCLYLPDLSFPRPPGSRRPLRAQPGAIPLARRLPHTYGHNRHRCNRFHCQQPLLHRDVHHDLAREPRPALPPERLNRPCPGARHVQRPDARPGSRPTSPATRRRTAIWPAICSRAARLPESQHDNPTAYARQQGCVVDAKVTWVRTISEDPTPSAFSFNRTFRCAVPLTGRCCSDWTAEINYLKRGIHDVLQRGQ